MVDLYSSLLYSIIFILPAYIANATPVIFGGGKPIDGGRKLNGKPIFGEHKTWRGLIAGILCGCIVALIESYFLPYMFVIGVAESFGTHFGDLLGSFIKRRMGINSGSSVFLLDQYPFFIFALLFALPFSMGYLPDIYGLLFITILTGVVHIVTNRIAFMLKLKSVPW